ncbi:hypothetical protein [Burkholderia pseudomallei]|uniref:hypothetical protein n=1 Tax=Burkholderia pseudomallei TaxID=28450 RepID=UPI001FBB0F21|nr:hypothetical protein [Burkholderia pseudomallei]
MVSLAAFLAAGFAFEARACGEGARRAGDRRRLVAGIGGHWRALVGAVAAGISARFADALFDMHVGLGALHSSGVRVLLDDTPTRRHADGSTVPSVYESIPVSPMQSRRLADSPIHRFTDLPIYRFASACRAAVPRPSGAERSIIGSRVHTTPTRRPPAVARPFEAARRRRHIRRASRPTAVHSLEAHRRRKP